jgi:hypothetical protein
MVRAILLAALVSTATGCAGKALYLTAHSPKGTSYLGKFTPGSSERVRHWLSPDSSLEMIRLTYAGADDKHVYLRVEGSSTHEVLLVPKSSESTSFALSGMELSAEWR